MFLAYGHSVLLLLIPWLYTACVPPSRTTVIRSPTPKSSLFTTKKQQKIP